MKSIKAILRPKKGQEISRGADTDHSSLPSSVAVDRKQKYGLFLLNPQSSHADTVNVGESYSVDIVAVHGITGDAFDTWTDPNGKLWLRDFLPNDLPGIRVFSFGYAAEVVFSLGTGDLDAYSRSLLEALKGQRRGTELRKRVIIFVCHSMGGIVVKKALNTAQVEDESFKTILDSVGGIFFLSTPHRGSSQTQLPFVLTSIANLALGGASRFIGTMRTDLIKSLQKDSLVLKDIATNFRNRTRHIRIASFVEQEKTPPATARIVDEVTGVMDIPGERIVPMLGYNHRTMCRFNHKDSGGYQMILGVFLDWIEELSHLTPSRDDLPCLHTLAFSEMTYRRLEVDRAHRNTCRWILQHKSYLNWTINERELLWLKGKPGSGKSTLLAFIYREYTRQPACKRAVYLDFFFHARGSPLQKTSEGMFRSLLHQVFTKCHVVRSPVRVAFEGKKALGEAGKAWRWHVRELEDLLFNAIIRAADAYTIVIFIDALDEAGAESAKELMAFFHRLKDEATDRNGNLKICISCRHYPVITRNLCLEICVENENGKDISTYVLNTLIPGGLVEDSKKEITNQWHALALDIIDKAAGIFQWVKLVVPLMNQLRQDGESLSYIKKRLAEVPKGLEEMYEYILTNIIEVRNRPRTLLMMQWIYLAVRPLSVRELRFAMASDCIESHESMHSGQDVNILREEDACMERLITSLSGGLAEVKYHENEGSRSEGYGNEGYRKEDDESEGYESEDFESKDDENGITVQFIHQSVNDFLRSYGFKNLAAVSMWQFFAQNPRLSENVSDKNILGHSHQRLLRSCINYLKLTEVIKISQDEFQVANEEPQIAKAETTSLQARLPFMDYATSFWGSHAQQAESHKVLQRDLIQQLNSPSGEAWKNWIQAYRFIKPYNRRCPEAGSTLFHIASSRKLQSVVHALLKEGTAVDEVDAAGNTALHHAAAWGHQVLIKKLLDAKAKIDSQNKSQTTPLVKATINGYVETVKLLLHRGADVNIRTGRGGNALQSAAQDGHVEMVLILLEAGADVNGQGGGAGSALQAASMNGHDIIVQCLLEAGAKVNAQGGDFANALRAASCYGHDFVVQRLLEAGADVNAQEGLYGNALQAASRFGHEVIVQRLLEAGADVNAQGGELGNALQATSYFGYDFIVQRLLEAGADVNAQGGSCGSALRAALHRERNKTVQLLLEAGADINTLSDVEQAMVVQLREKNFSQQDQHG